MTATGHCSLDPADSESKWLSVHALTSGEYQPHCNPPLKSIEHHATSGSLTRDVVPPGARESHGSPVARQQGQESHPGTLPSYVR